MEQKCKLLDEQLRRIPLDEVRSFHGHFTDCIDRAYSWQLCAAAYVICGGCGDDGFWDFRSTLVSMGRETFERALSDPESLADLSLEELHQMQWEGYQYVPSKVEEDLSGGQEFPRSSPHPREPSGERWDDSKVPELYPKLAERHGESWKWEVEQLIDRELAGEPPYAGRPTWEAFWQTWYAATRKYPDVTCKWKELKTTEDLVTYMKQRRVARGLPPYE
jgi:hypothetical protein